MSDGLVVVGCVDLERTSGWCVKRPGTLHRIFDGFVVVGCVALERTGEWCVKRPGTLHRIFDGFVVVGCVALERTSGWCAKKQRTLHPYPCMVGLFSMSAGIQLAWRYIITYSC